MTNVGVLLEYLSELGCGSWREFKQALSTSEAAADTPAVWVARDLAALGHLEVQPETREWSVCPPSLVQLPIPSKSATAVLCGARSPKFLARVNAQSEQFGGRLEYSIEGVVARMSFELEDAATLAALSAQCGISLIADAAERLAGCLPAVESLIRSARSEHVGASPGLERLVDAPAKGRHTPWLKWAPADAVRRSGVYRQEWGFRTVYWWSRLSGSALDVRRVSKAVALYGHRPNLMSYDARTQTVEFPSEARPPDLYLRALVLCSGYLPSSVGPGRLAARNVPPDIASTIMEKLAQEGS
jgi:hypothetical protein